MIVLGQFFTSSVSIGLAMFQLTLVRVVLDFFFCTGCDFFEKGGTLHKRVLFALVLRRFGHCANFLVLLVWK
jgi:hypothetical protein